jgi:PIN domain nuclease of toxin-antitoxin system
MDLLLDTCTFLWLALEPEKIPAKGAEVLNDTSNRRMLSMVSVLEMVLKYRTGKLPLPRPPEEWIPSRRSYFAIAPIPLSDPVIFRSRHLPGTHADPFDRLIAAQALELKCPVLTSDRWIGSLGADILWEK